MNTNSEPIAPSSGGNQDKPLTLDDYYADSKMSAGILLIAWTKSGVPTLRPDERRDLLARLKSVDADYRRTLLLARKALTTKKRAVANAAMAWVLHTAVADIGGDESPALQSSAVDLFRSILRARLTMPSAKKRPKSDVNLALLSLLSLYHTRQLRPIDAESCLRETFGAREDTLADVERLDRQAIALLAARPNNLGHLLNLVRPWNLRIGIEQSRAATLESQAKGAAARIVELEQAEMHYRDEVAHLTKQCQGLRDELDSTKQKANEQRQGVDYKLQEIRSRSAAFLNGLADGHLAIIKEAAQLDPPRVAVIREKIELAVDAIEREVKWLRSSD